MKCSLVWLDEAASSTRVTRLQLSLLSLHRGTKDFTILLSADGTTWDEALKGTLDSVANKGCDVPVVDFYLGGQRTERYVRLVLNTFHGVGAGMQWINFEEKGAPGPVACEWQSPSCRQGQARV